MALPLLATGCKGLGVLGTPPTAGPDVSALRHAIAGEKLLISRYRAVLARSPGLRGRLGPLLAQHRDHLSALDARLVDRRAHPPARPSASLPGVPHGASAAIAYLREAEKSAASTLLGHLGVVPPSLAQLFASIAASEATHAEALRARGRPR